MEFSPIEKIDLSNIRVQKNARTALTTKILALDVGQAVTVTGVEREAINARLVPLRKEGRGFVTQKLGFGQFRIIRHS